MGAAIILVHGAWHDGSCWARVVPLLEAAGYSVHCPTLVGLAPDYSGEPPSLAEQIAGLVDYIEREDLHDVALVGHSWSGMVIAGVVGPCAARLRALIFLDAALPAEGDDFASQVPGQDIDALVRRRAMYRAMAPDSRWLPPPPVQMVGITEAEDAAWLTPRLRPHPLRTWLEPVRVDEKAMAKISKTYVLAISPASAIMGYPAQAERASQTRGWTRRDIATGHDMMVTAPDETAALIIEAASR